MFRCSQDGCQANKTGRDGKMRMTTLKLSDNEKKLTWTGRRGSMTSKETDDRSILVSELLEIDTSGGPLTATLVLMSDSLGAKRRLARAASSSTLTSTALGRASMISHRGCPALVLSFEGVLATNDVGKFAQVMAALQHLVSNLAEWEDGGEREEEAPLAPEQAGAVPASAGSPAAAAAPADDPAEQLAEQIVSTAVVAAIETSSAAASR